MTSQILNKINHITSLTSTNTMNSDKEEDAKYLLSIVFPELNNETQTEEEVKFIKSS